MTTVTQQLEDVNEEKESHFLELQSAQQINHEIMVL